MFIEIESDAHDDDEDEDEAIDDTDDDEYSEVACNPLIMLEIDILATI